MHFGGLFLWLTFLLSYPFYQKNWRTLILLVRLLVPPVQTSGGVYLGFQCPTCMFCFLHALNYLDLDSPLVQHLLISWQTVWHPRPFAHLLFKRWCFYLSLYSLFQGLNRIPWTVLYVCVQSIFRLQVAHLYCSVPVGIHWFIAPCRLLMDVG